jgi:hypothetical protein
VLPSLNRFYLIGRLYTCLCLSSHSRPCRRHRQSYRPGLKSLRALPNNFGALLCAFVQLECPVCVKGSTIHDHVRPVAFQGAIENKVLGPTSRSVKEKFKIHGHVLENKGNGTFKIVILAFATLTNILKLLTPLRRELNADLSNLL